MMENRVKTVGLLALLTGLLLWAGHALGGGSGLALAAVLAFGMNLGSWWFSDRIVLALHGAKPLGLEQAPELYGLVQDLAMRAGLPPPRLFLLDEEAPNAFATGRDPEHGVVAVTRGLLETLDRRELAGVIAHELAHIRHRDTLVMSVAAGLGGAVSMLGDLALWAGLAGRGQEEDGHPAAGLLGALVAPFVALLVQMGISRAREFLADAGAAAITQDPGSLACALRKLEARAKRVPMETGTAATAHLFIVNPLSAEGLAGLFSTHPPARERIRRLERMERTGVPALAG